MSTNRVNPKAGWAKPTGLCRYCKLDVKRYDSRKRTFCSDACIHEWKIRSNPAYAREEVWKRDKGVCTHCQLDTEKLIKDLRVACLPHLGSDRLYAEEMFFRTKGLEPISFIASSRVSLWDMDHILPVYKGGGECGLEGLQTLCYWCHKKKTRQDLAR